MSLRFTVLASGSSANASLLECGGFGVLIDAGLGPRQLAQRLGDVAASWQHIHAVLLTHTHADHWNERTLAHLERRNIALYCHHEHAEILSGSPAFAELRTHRLVHFYEAGDIVCLGWSLQCRPIRVRHDGGATFAFHFESLPDLFGRTWSLGYATDLGTWDTGLVEAFQNVHALAVEFNHDVSLTQNSGRPGELIARVLGDDGHLSNEQAADLAEHVLRRSEPGRLQHVVQLHLSRECNRPCLARVVAEEKLGSHGVQIHDASQQQAGPALTIGPVYRRRGSRPPLRRGLSAESHQPCFAGWE